MSAVVVGYVPTAEGRAALDRGIVEARLRRLPLVVVNATQGDVPGDERDVPGLAVAALQAELAALDIDAQLRQLDEGGDIADELGDVATELEADLIVIGLRRPSPVGKLILGSAASRILLTAHHPILTVKPR